MCSANSQLDQIQNGAGDYGGQLASCSQNVIHIYPNARALLCTTMIIHFQNVDYRHISFINSWIRTNYAV